MVRIGVNPAAIAPPPDTHAALANVIAEELGSPALRSVSSEFCLISLDAERRALERAARAAARREPLQWQQIPSGPAAPRPRSLEVPEVPVAQLVDVAEDRNDAPPPGAPADPIAALVRELAEMGFAGPAVQQAIDAIGPDKARVVERLLNS